MKHHRVLAIALLGTVLAFGACTSDPEQPPATEAADASSPETEESPDREPEGSQGSTWEGPDFSIETFEGDTFELAAAAAGKPVVINFWESW